MKNFIVCAALVAAASAPAGAQLAGEPITSGSGSFFAGPYVGYMTFGEYAEFSNGADLSYENSPIYGVQAGYSFGPNFTLLGNLGYSKTKQSLKGAGSGTDNDLPISDDVGVFLYDANLQVRLPFAMGMGNASIAPFVQGGVGQVKYTADYDDLASRGTTNTAFNVGLGADVQISRYVGLRLMAKDYITSSSWDDIENVTFDDDVKNNTANNLAFSLGLNFGF
jgi:hypothetical protein